MDRGFSFSSGAVTGTSSSGGLAVGFTTDKSANAQYLLRAAELRKLCFECAAAGKKYSADLLKVACKAQAVAAVEKARDRLKRRAALVVQQNDLQTRLIVYKKEKRRLLGIAHKEDLDAFVRTINGVFRSATAGTHSLEVVIEPLDRSVGATGTSCLGESYSCSCSYRRTDSRHTYLIPPHWRETVAERGLAIVDGLVTLSTALESEQEGVLTYRAVWVMQGRGFSLVTRRGWIACRDGASCHSTKSAKAAQVGVRQKLAWRATPADVLAARRSSAAATRAKRRTEQLSRLTERLSRLDLADVGHVEVTYEDSRRVGNCHDGTVAFGQQLFGDDRRKATIGEMVAVISGRGEHVSRFVTTELGRQFLAACLQAIRRHRRTIRLDRECQQASSWPSADDVAENAFDVAAVARTDHSPPH
jgi:hypothetical protein